MVGDARSFEKYGPSRCLHDQYLRYVRCVDVDEYHRLGWMISAYYGQRGAYDCFIMAWVCGCHCVEPLNTVACQEARLARR